MQIDKEIAKLLYDNYAITTLDPVPFEEFITIDDEGNHSVPDKIRYAYQKGIVEVPNQLTWLHKFTKERQDEDYLSVYDLGFTNALEMVMHILGIKEPEYCRIELVELDEEDFEDE